MISDKQKICLVVHKSTLMYIESTIMYIQKALCEFFQCQINIEVCEEIDQVAKDDFLHFIIGENFGRFVRLSGAKYVYMNFSIIRFIPEKFYSYSLTGLANVLKKRSKFLDKASLFDAVLDFVPNQGIDKIGSLPPVLYFPSCIERHHNDLIPSVKRFDICFVGELTPRRLKLIRSLQDSGYKISPTNGISLDKTVARSDICINLRAYRSVHAEIPRIVTSFAFGTPLVSEKIDSVFGSFPSDFLIQASYGKIKQKIEAVLDGNEVHQEDYRARILDWYSSYYNTCRRIDFETLRSLVQILER